MHVQELQRLGAGLTMMGIQLSQRVLTAHGSQVMATDLRQPGWC